MTDDIRPLNDDYRSAGQLTPAQITQAAAQGFQSVFKLRLPAAFLERVKTHGLGPEQPQIQQFLHAYYGDKVFDR